MDNPIAFILSSKRFWTGILAIPIGLLLTKFPIVSEFAVNICTAMNDAQDAACSPPVAKVFMVGGVAYAVVWLVGMWLGQTKLTLFKSSATVTGVFKRVPIVDSQQSGDANATTPGPKVD
jgi:hypothetical protein